MKPVLQALVVADHVYRDGVTGKHIIVGTFNSYKFSRKPTVAQVETPDGTNKTIVAGGIDSGSPYAYVCLTDVCQGTKFRLQFVNLSKNVVLFGTEAVVQDVNRLSAIEMAFPLPRLPIKEAGVYAFEVVWENEILGSWRITAEDLDQKCEGPKNDADRH
ncbi:MAG: hypothetical protein K8R46_07480 [Pirellulales bacterium]|nr:hypothetical protein [Pirellulales bacterium]